MVVASHLTKVFGPRTAIDDVSFSLQRGEVVALLGPNGAGKTTTLRLLAGLLAPTSGTVALDGVVRDRATWPAARRQIGFLTETPGLWDRLTVEANLHTYARLQGLEQPRRRVATLLERFDLADRAGDPAGTLSKGMRQKVAWPAPCCHDPAVVLLDEPTAGLDPEMTRSVRELVGELRANGRAVLLSTHNLDEAERVADRVAVMRRTLVAFDTPDRVALAVRGRPRAGDGRGIGGAVSRRGVAGGRGRPPSPTARPCRARCRTCPVIRQRSSNASFALARGSARWRPRTRGSKPSTWRSCETTNGSPRPGARPAGGGRP